jgi:hypothetical protein
MEKHSTWSTARPLMPKPNALLLSGNKGCEMKHERYKFSSLNRSTRGSMPAIRGRRIHRRGCAFAPGKKRGQYRDIP